MPPTIGRYQAVSNASLHPHWPQDGHEEDRHDDLVRVLPLRRARLGRSTYFSRPRQPLSTDQEDFVTYCFRYFVANLRYHGLRQSLRTLVWNIRFEAGYRLGGFTSARRDF
jgi:hypothetical protein